MGNCVNCAAMDALIGSAMLSAIPIAVIDDTPGAFPMVLVAKVSAEMGSWQTNLVDAWQLTCPNE
jgi:hypothetical protein